jgi:hypothetical protein
MVDLVGIEPTTSSMPFLKLMKSQIQQAGTAYRRLPTLRLHSVVIRAVQAHGCARHIRRSQRTRRRVLRVLHEDLLGPAPVAV